MFSLPLGQLLIGSIIAAFIGLSAYLIAPKSPSEANVIIFPQEISAAVGADLTVEVIVESGVPVNAFAGKLTFDPDQLEVVRIDYNNSVADLWAEKPWYENGAGTINFAGGTTRPGGFTGYDTLLTITFRATAAGGSALTISDAQVLKHDGLGSDATLAAPIDAIFSITSASTTLIETGTTKDTTVRIASAKTPLDLTGDGKIGLGDVSIFLQLYATGDTRGDFDDNGKTTLADLSILLDSF